MTDGYLSQVTSDPEQMRRFQQERLIVAVTELICREMRSKKVRRKEIAELLGKSRGRVSQYLDGERNLTLRTVADILWALGLTLKIDVEPITVQKSKQSILLGNVTQAWRAREWSVRQEVMDPDASVDIAG